MAELKSTNLMNVELRWAHLAEPSTLGEFASNKYEVTVVFGKDQLKVVNELKNSRQTVKETEDGRYSITLKSSRKPRVIDRNKSIMDDEKIKKIGNGTTAHVAVNQYKGFKDAVFLGLNQVMVMNFQEYTGTDAFANVDVDADDSAPFNTDDDELI